MKHWKVILAATLIFITGAATGVFAFRAAYSAAERPREPGGPPPMMDRRFDFLGRLKKDLHLTEAQAEKIDAVLQEGSKRTRQLWDTVQPQMREEMKRVHERIKAELTPEQQVQFDEQSKRFRDRRGPRPQGTNSGGDSFRKGSRHPSPPPEEGGPNRGPGAPDRYQPEQRRGPDSSAESQPGAGSVSTNRPPP